MAMVKMAMVKMAMVKMAMVKMAMFYFPPEGLCVSRRMFSTVSRRLPQQLYLKA